MIKKSVIDKYLQHFAEPEIALLDSLPIQMKWQAACVIPAFNETPEFLIRIDKSFNDQQLFVIVINQPDDAQDDTEQKTLFLHIKNNYQLSWCNQCLYLFHGNLSILVVDRFTKPILKKQGVGLARKIGMDICCYLVENQQISSPFVGTSDADAYLPHNYFQELADTEIRYSAVCFDFEHVGEQNNITEATIWYEASLQYYRAGMHYAGSTYAYFTIGSIIGINILFYAHVRGFPKLAAGEDFYLLNKLNKLAAIYFNPICKIKIHSRISNRVPFGTGPKVASLIIKNNKKTYNPLVFQSLKKIIQTMQNNNICIVDDVFTDTIEKKALYSLGFEQFQRHCIQQNMSINQSQKHFTIWFDAFKQLKYIHFLTKNDYPKLFFTLDELYLNINKFLSNSDNK